VKSIAIVLSIALAGLFAACGPLYSAPAANAPLFGSGGEMHAAGHVGLFGQLDFQGALSPIDHFGLTVALSMYNRHNDDPHGHYYGDLGLAGYIPFGIGRFEVIAGGGYGRSWGKFPVAMSSSDTDKLEFMSNYFRAYAQADIGLSTRVVDFGFMCRWSWVSWDEITYTDDAGTPQQRTPRDGFFEPMLFVRIGWDFIKFELQGGLILPTVYSLETWWIPFHFSIGLHFRFDLWGDIFNEEEPSQEAPKSDQDGGWQPAPGFTSRLW
jgi:hypothetical protein